MSYNIKKDYMKNSKRLKVYNSLKKGDTVTIKYSDTFSGHRGYSNYTVKSKRVVGKGKKYQGERITLVNKNNPTGVKSYLYRQKSTDIYGNLKEPNVWYSSGQIQDMKKGETTGGQLHKRKSNSKSMHNPMNSLSHVSSYTKKLKSVFGGKGKRR